MGLGSHPLRAVSENIFGVAVRLIAVLTAD